MIIIHNTFLKTNMAKIWLLKSIPVKNNITLLLMLVFEIVPKTFI